MIKINLLDSVTERQGGAVIAVDRKISSPTSKLLLMSVAVALFADGGYWLGISSARRWLKPKPKENWQNKNKSPPILKPLLKEMKDLEAKIQNIDSRIEVIKKLRDSQAGPRRFWKRCANELQWFPDFISKPSNKPAIRCASKAIHRMSGGYAIRSKFGIFGGLFSNLNIETQRKDAPNQPASDCFQPAAKRRQQASSVLRFAVLTRLQKRAREKRCRQLRRMQHRLLPNQTPDSTTKRRRSNNSDQNSKLNLLTEKKQPKRRKSKC